MSVTDEPDGTAQTVSVASVRAFRAFAVAELLDVIEQLYRAEADADPDLEVFPIVVRSDGRVERFGDNTGVPLPDGATAALLPVARAVITAAPEHPGCLAGSCEGEATLFVYPGGYVEGTGSAVLTEGLFAGREVRDLLVAGKQSGVVLEELQQLLGFGVDAIDHEGVRATYVTNFDVPLTGSYEGSIGRGFGVRRRTTCE